MTVKPPGDNAFLDIGDPDIEALIGPFVDRDVEERDPMWRDIVVPMGKGLRRLARRRRLYRLLGRSGGRTKAGNVAGYDKEWRKKGLGNLISAGKVRPCIWRDRHFLARTGALKRLHQLMLVRTIDQFGPRRLLEVGFGNGQQLFPLACRFPDIEFWGIEITESGVAVGRNIQNQGTLPAEMEDFAAEPVRDRTRHRDVRIVRADAEQLPFSDSAFDMTYTSLSLSLMTHFLPPVMAEIARVTRDVAVFVEPWPDFNLSDLQRNYRIAKDYMAMPIKDLTRFGLTPIFAGNDIPCKAHMSIGCVIGRKSLRAAPADIRPQA
jgi:SAM-dependent methyltransferase